MEGRRLATAPLGKRGARPNAGRSRLAHTVELARCEDKQRHATGALHGRGAGTSHVADVGGLSPAVGALTPAASRAERAWRLSLCHARLCGARRSNRDVNALARIAEDIQDSLRSEETGRSESPVHRHLPLRSIKPVGGRVISFVRPLCHGSAPSRIAASHSLWRTQRNLLSVVITASSIGPPHICENGENFSALIVLWMQVCTKSMASRIGS